MTNNETQAKVHIPTVIAVSAVAWALVNIPREVVGHAGAAIVVGIPVKAASTSTAYMKIDWTQLVAEHRLNSLG